MIVSGPSWTTPSRLRLISTPGWYDTLFVSRGTEGTGVGITSDTKWIGGTSTSTNGKVGRKSGICRWSFVWWGSSELRERLSRPDQIGRRYYWFGNYGFDQTWFEGRLAEAIETAGPRYTPEAHVELDIVRDLEAFARTGDWFIGIKSLAIEIRQSLGHLRRPVSNNRQPVHIPSLVPLVSAVEAVLDGFAELEFAPAGDIDLAQIHKTIANAVPLSERSGCSCEGSAARIP